MMLTIGVWVLAIAVALLALMLAPWAVNQADKIDVDEKEKEDEPISSDS